jgi:hypothetical protein
MQYEISTNDSSLARTVIKLRLYIVVCTSVLLSIDEGELINPSNA